MPGGPAYQSPGGQISFDVIGEAWNLFKMQMGTWIGAIFIAGILFGVVYGIGITAMVVPMIAAGAANGGTADVGITAKIVQLVFTYAVTVIGFILIGGLLRMGIKQVRGENISIGDMFSVTDVLLPLLGTALLTVILGQIGTIMCIIPGFIAYGLTMFALPLVVDQRLGAIAAISQSFNMLKKDWLMATLFYFCVAFIGGIGIMGCCVGGLFTYPVFILSIALTYRNYMMNSGGGAPFVPNGAPLVPGVYAPTTPGSYAPPAPGSYMTGSDYAATPGSAPMPTPAPGYAPTTGYAPPAETAAPNLNGYNTPAAPDNNGPTVADNTTSGANLNNSPTLYSAETPREDPPRL